jgi:integrase
MKRGAGEGHIKRITLRSGKTAWRGWLTVGYRANGTPIRRSVQRRTRDEVRVALVQLREKYQQQGKIDFDSEQMRLDTLLDKWLAHFEATASHKKRTPATYGWAIARIKAGLGNPLVVKVTPMKLQSYLTQEGESLKRGSISLLRAVLNGAFRQALLWRIRSDNPAIGIKLPRSVATDERKIITTAQAQTLLSELVAERIGLAVAFTYILGMRPGEAAALRHQDIDLDACELTIRGTHNVVGQTIVREEPKSKRGQRTIHIVPELRPWIEQHQARARAERIMMGEAWPEPDEDLLFVRESDGGRISNHLIYQLSRRIAERVGIGKVGPRILRRSMLSHLAQSGIGAKVRAALGGHTEEITEHHYHEVDQSETRAAIELLRPTIPHIPDDSASNAGSNAV